MMLTRIASTLVGFLMLVAVPLPAVAQIFTCVPADCDDRNPCTRDRCLAGTCFNTPVVCDDNNACTTEGCIPSNGTGQCERFSTTTCNDNNLCTTETCNPATGQCQNTGITTCNDNNACTTEACNPATGNCQTTNMVVCNDNNGCTTDVCDPSNGQCRFIQKCGWHGDLAIKLSSAEVKTTYKRKKGGASPDEYVKVTVSDVVLVDDGGTTRKVKVGVKAVVKGPEANLASLIYPIAAMKLGSGAATEMRNQGYDFTVVDTAPRCPDLLPADVCAVLAQQVSKTVDASLATGPSEDRDAFREAAGLFGVPPDTCVFVP